MCNMARPRERVVSKRRDYFLIKTVQNEQKTSFIENLLLNTKFDIHNIL